ADELNFNVLSRTQPGELDEVHRQIQNLDRFTHVENEYLAAGCQCAGLDDQLHGLRDQHEIACRLPVGDRERTTGGYLLTPDRNHRAPAIENVAEAHRYVFRLRPRGQILNDQLGDALGRAHDRARVNGFVAGDKDESFDVVLG